MRSTTGDLWSFARAQMAYLSNGCLELFPHENGALPLSYRPRRNRAGFEPAASPLAVEVSREAVTGEIYESRRLCDLSILAWSFDLLDSSNTRLAETRIPYVLSTSFDLLVPQGGLRIQGVSAKRIIVLYPN